MTPTPEQIDKERLRAEEIWSAIERLEHKTVEIEVIATALATRAIEAAAEERRLVRIELSCIWDPTTTHRLTEICKTCQWPRNRGPFIHVDKDDTDADAIRALRGAPTVSFSGVCGVCGQLVSDGRAVHRECAR
jgi:hypothetical protein